MALIYPVDPSTRITSPFGERTSPTAGASTNHKGLDFAVPANTTVKAAGAGTVINVGYDNSRGNFVQLDNGNGIQTNYYHLNKALVKRAILLQQGRG